MRSLVLIAVLAACGSKKHKDDAAPAPADAARISTARDAAVLDAAAPARAEHAAFRLVDNRHTAHRAVDGEVVLDAADIGFTRYTRFGQPTPRWHLGKMIDNERAAVADRLASLDVPLSH